ncbi:MAG: hypothetical protein H7Z38_12715 [Rubrivivax sp.]|nr:hypothetical protein [Pyrinomonadaceae bacterium]
MRLGKFLCALIVACVLLAAGCRQGSGGNANGDAPASPPRAKEAAALPDSGFKALITVDGAPSKLRAGQKETIQVKVKNASDVQWYSRGGEVNSNPDNRFYLAAGNRWMKADGQTLVTNMDGRHGIQRDLKPGEEEEVPLQVTAPKEPGEYVLEIDLIQEQVAFFSDKGSQTAKLKITVVK